jgi:hypothetical protein
MTIVGLIIGFAKSEALSDSPIFAMKWLCFFSCVVMSLFIPTEIHHYNVAVANQPCVPIPQTISILTLTGILIGYHAAFAWSLHCLAFAIQQNRRRLRAASQDNFEN